ncbi:MAG: family 16 glycosylhydrolase [Verrucomicrobia bacterium]|jgi:beta-glucanase (GH16 family)|nr:family 16 glycosylhydrolase [Verrucomicrobiota bacterium]
MKLTFKRIQFRAGPLALGVAVLTFPVPAQADWQQVWSDEFEGASVDTNHWTFDGGNGYWSGDTWISGWGNNELEYYTSRTQNVYVANGVLHLVARKEPYNGFSYTSGRLKSLGRFSKKYGRFEFRAKLPQGQGYWPALWLLPDFPVFPGGQYGNWAASGEIDVMENRGSAPTTTGGAIHYGGPWPNNAHSGASYVFPGGEGVTNFHNYMLEWGTNSMKWYVDGILFWAQTSWWSSAAAYPAPFDQPFYMIMNLAVGGNYDGNPTVSTVFPGEMQVDYVRVYDDVDCSTPPTLTAGNNGPIWSGMTLNLTASSVPGAIYSWTGPNGFNSTNQNPSLVNASTDDSGLYSVTAATGGCTSAPAMTEVAVNPPAGVSIESLGGSVILSWPAGTLQSATNLAGPWQDVSGAASPRTKPAAASQELYRLNLQ